MVREKRRCVAHIPAPIGQNLAERGMQGGALLACRTARSAISRGGDSQAASEVDRQMARADEADLLRDEGERPVCRRQEEPRSLDPATDDVLVWGSAGGYFEQASKVV
jgi:hypothetical protein